MTTTIRIDKAVHYQLKEISDLEKKSMNDVIEKLILEHKKKKFWDKYKEATEKLRNDPQKWKEELEDRKLYENTLLDGHDE